ncbi:MAG TPA: NAD(P)-dependent oxidoreductase, partial [Limnochordia bacterium]|nr:NAD(P)-dependent oxidoreductase [Limnochordia bacterium]
MRTFPVFLIGAKLPRVLVVGGNHEAARKVGELLEAQAPQIDVVATEVCAALSERIDGRRVVHHARAYRPEDLDGAALVIATDLDKPLNARIWTDAAGRGILVNCLDDPERCHYYNGSVV